jgi:hypothetical protein
MFIDQELKNINKARISRGDDPITKEELVSNLKLNRSILLGGEASDHDRQKILEFRDQQYDLAIKATPSWIKVAWLTILILVIFGISRLF